MCQRTYKTENTQTTESCPEGAEEDIVGTVGDASALEEDTVRGEHL